MQLVQMRRSLAAFRAEQASFDADIAAKRGDVERSERTLAERRKLVALNNERLDIYLKLENRGVGVRSNTLDAREGEQNQVVALAAEESRVASLEAEAVVLAAKKRERREAYPDRVATELVEAERTAATLRQDLAKAELMERASVLKAPVSGRVQQVAVTTLGQVVQTGQELMVVVPDGTALEIEGLLPNREKGFVREGQSVRVKLEAFPFTRFGTLAGRVITVSNDAVPAGSAQGAASGPLMFPVRIALDSTTIRADGVDVALTPGMAVTGEVKTGERRVLEFLLDPLIETTQGAFHER